MSLASPIDGTIAELLREQSIGQPQACAILAPGRSPLGFAGLWQQVSELAVALHSLGATATTRVAIVLPNGPEMATVFLATAACSVCAPLNPACRAEDLRFCLEDLQARVVIVRKGEGGPVIGVAKELGIAVLEIETDPALPAGRFRVAASPSDRVAAPQWPGPQDIALLLHTSGTTARPKIVALSQVNLVASSRAIARHLALQPGDRCLNVMPLFHIHGLVGALLASVAGGSSIVCTPGFDDHAFFDWTAHFEPTWYTAVPTIHQAVVANGALYRQKAPAHRFRFVRSSSAALPVKLFERLQDLTGAPVVEAYGMTEASHQIASNPLPPGKRKPGSVGIAAGAHVALMDDAGRLLGPGDTGEIVIRGPGVTAGYQNNPQANAMSFIDGWSRTGDTGRFDDEGYLFISGRLKEIVNRGGEKISPREIDDALLEHPDVVQAVAFAVPHPTLGEELAAAVVLRDGSTADEEQLRGFLFERIAEFKVPSAIVFVDAIPTGATGKVQRTSLHDKLGQQIAKAFVNPRTALERSLEAIFREVLGCAALGVHDSFFVAGGDSLKGAQVIARIHTRHGVELPLLALFRHPSIASLSREVDTLRWASAIAMEEIAAEVEALSDEEVARLLADEPVAASGAIANARRSVGVQ